MLKKLNPPTWVWVLLLAGGAPNGLQWLGEKRAEQHREADLAAFQKEHQEMEHRFCLLGAELHTIHDAMERYFRREGIDFPANFPRAADFVPAGGFRCHR